MGCMPFPWNNDTEEQLTGEQANKGCVGDAAAIILLIPLLGALLIKSLTQLV